MVMVMGNGDGDGAVPGGRGPGVPRVEVVLRHCLWESTNPIRRRRAQRHHERRHLGTSAPWHGTSLTQPTTSYSHPHVLGIDVGTGGTRAVIIDDSGRIVASAVEDHEPFHSPETGWVEQHPDDWWRAAQLAIRAVLAKDVCEPASIRAIGLSGQMHGAVLLDADDQVLRPAIIWCDQRTDAQCRWLTDRVGASRLIALTSNPALTGFTLPKLLWVRDHKPEIWNRVRTVLLPKDYVRLKLTGDHATDVADASGTLMFNVAERCWSDAILETTQIDRAWLPSTHEGPDVTGRIRAEVAADTGLSAGTLVVAGGGDQAAGAVGMGSVTPGAVSVTIGTSGVVFASTDHPALDPSGRVHTFCHVVPGHWHVMGVTQAAGLSLRWFRDRPSSAPRRRHHMA